jgi:hypothetical protein
MAVCQNLTLGVLSNHSVLSVLVGVLFKKVGLFLNKVVHIWLQIMKGGSDYLQTTCKFPGIPCKGQLESSASFTPGGRL